jgi:hypothetical protein
MKPGDLAHYRRLHATSINALFHHSYFYPAFKQFIDEVLQNRHLVNGYISKITTHAESSDSEDLFNMAKLLHSKTSVPEPPTDFINTIKMCEFTPISLTKLISLTFSLSSLDKFMNPDNEPCPLLIAENARKDFIVASIHDSDWLKEKLMPIDYLKKRYRSWEQYLQAAEEQLYYFFVGSFESNYETVEDFKKSVIDKTVWLYKEHYKSR